MAKFIPFLKRPAQISVLRLHGTIAASGSGSLNDASLAPVIERAFAKKPKAVALVINSPGGSPVQSSLIAARIRRLADKHKIPVHAFVEDIAASGGYWLASAADDIWIDPGSILGSVGVIYAGFGFNELMQNHGVERRVHTAGLSKSFGDPFRAETPADVAKIRALLDPLHQVFIDQIKTRRGARLNAEADLFNADIWVGAGAVSVGLADGLAHMRPKLEQLYGEKLAVKSYGVKRKFMQRFGLSFGQAALGTLEERAIWARYGL